MENKKFIVIPDSFKGTLSSTKICAIIKEEIIKVFPNSTCLTFPVADGGEGTVDCFIYGGKGKRVFCNVCDPYFNKMESFYGVLNDGTAVIEMASCAGLPLVENKLNPMLTTTFGVGELILDAISKGAKKIIVGLGGSCTNDFGAGACSALGVKFFDKDNKEFIPTGKTLIDVCKIDVSLARERLKDIKITAMCDIDNPTFGKNGAAYVFAPQKGADENMVKLLDDGLKHISSIVKRDLSVDVENLCGGGAAGAFGAGLYSLIGANLNSGINTILDTVNFDGEIEDADYIITGEGKIDSQSLRGKVVIGISKRAKQKGVPVIAIVGGAESGLDEAYNLGVSSIITINRLPQDFSVSRFNSEQNLKETTENILRLLKI